VALKLCKEDFIAHQIKLWLDDQLNGRTNLPLDLYTWRTLAFGALGQAYTSLLNIPEYDFRYRKVIHVNNIDVMGMFSNPDLTIQNFWNDGTGHISCAFQAFGDRQRGIFYANQLDVLMVSQVIGDKNTHGLAYTLNRQGYEGVDPTVPVLSSSVWYILAKNGVNPFLSKDFQDNVTKVSSPPYGSSPLSVFPNPFAGTLTIYSPLIDGSSAFIHIYNKLGQRVKTIHLKASTGTSQSFIWDGSDDKGYQVTSGIYLIQLISGKQVENVPVIFLGR